MRRKVHLARNGSQRRLARRRMETKRELALILVRAMRMKIICQNQTKHTVTKKLEALVAATSRCGAGMGQRLGNQVTVAELVADGVLEPGEVGARPSPGQ